MIAFSCLVFGVHYTKGGSVWIGIQDIGQIDKLSSKELRQSIINACGSILCFGVSDPITAEFLSNKIGEEEVYETEESDTMGTENYRDSIHISRKRKVRKLVLPSDLQNLEDLTAYFKLPNFDMTKVNLAFKNYPYVHPPFVLKDHLILQKVYAKWGGAKQFPINQGGESIFRYRGGSILLYRSYL